MTPGRFDKSHLDMKVSVVITCYNLEKYITRAIHSCINQSLPEQFYEIIVVDDCSTDNSWERINEFDFITTISMKMVLLWFHAYRLITVSYYLHGFLITRE